jgi:alpha,alpha-trehalase
LPRLKVDHGVLTSSRETGSQWDKPFMWAPLVMVTVEALERYDYYTQALEIASGFLRMIIKDYERTGKLYEKYDGLRGTSDVSSMIHMGYSENVEGFAWTNSVILELSHAIDRQQHKLRGEPLQTPDILTQFTVIESGKARPQYPSADMPAAANSN